MMPITYPIQIPTLTGVESIKLYADHAVAVSRSPFTFTGQAQNYGGQRWRASVSIPPLPREQAEVWVAFLLKLKGQFGTFLMGDPAGRVARGSLGGTPVVDALHPAGSDTVSIRGATANATGWLLTGDYIRFGSGSTSRLHKVLDDVNINSTGRASINIWPNTRYNLSDATPVGTVSPQGLWRLSVNTSEWDINSATFYGIQFECEEVV